MRVVSGGQTGVDRAALDAAVESGLQSGGWCPQNRLAEDGSIPSKYLLRETPSEHYQQRTNWNVRDSDATLILLRALPLQGGTLMTRMIAEHLCKPVYVALIDETNPEMIANWLQRNNVGVLNVAGPRESKEPGIAAQSELYLRKLFTLWKTQQEQKV